MPRFECRVYYIVNPDGRKEYLGQSDTSPGIDKRAQREANERSQPIEVRRNKGDKYITTLMPEGESAEKWREHQEFYARQQQEKARERGDE